MKKAVGRFRLLGMVSLVILLMTGFGTKAAAAESVTYPVTDTITAVLADGVLTVSGTGEMPDYTMTITDFYTGENVSNYSPWYGERQQIRKIVVEDGITRIGSACFYSCAVEEVSLSPGILSIGACAFSDCSSLVEIELPLELTEIDGRLFEGAYSLERVTFGDKITRIGVDAFFGTKIKEIHFPASLVQLDYDEALTGTALEVITVDPENPAFMTRDGILFSKDGKRLLYAPRNIIADDYQCTGVEEVAAWAFANCEGLTGVDLSGVQIVGESAFGSTGLTEVFLPDSVTTVKTYAFSYCEDLESVRLSENLKKLDFGAFQNCTSLDSVIFGSGLETISDNCFIYTAFTELTIPENVQTISTYAFANNDVLEKVTINGTAFLDRLCFARCHNLNSVVLAEGVERIEEGAFYDDSSLSAVTFPSSLTYIGPNAFWGTGVTNIPEQLEKQPDGSYLLLAKVFVTGTYDYQRAYEVLELVNEERAKEGLTPLVMDQDLLETAMLRSAECSLTFSHERPNGLWCFSANYKMCAENIAAGSPTAAGTMSQWMNSDGHRGNILGSFTSIGIGCFVTDSGYVYYWTQCFGVDSAEAFPVPENREVRVEIGVTPGFLKGRLTLEVGDVSCGGSGEVRVLYSGRYEVKKDRFRFSVSPEDVAEVDAAGRITGLKAGSFTVTGVWGSLTAEGTGTVSGGWIRDSRGWKFMNADGTFVRGQWKLLSGSWYSFDSQGYMRTGWYSEGGKWYYLSASGIMKTGWVQVSGSWYYFNGSGVMQTGWQQIGGKWYYLGTGGAMQTGWQQIGGKWYRLGSDGAMKTGWVKDGNKWFYLNSGGVMQTGWQQIGGKWYYLGTGGAMQTGWQQIGGSWYYLGTGGAMQTGWVTVSGKSYFLRSSGVMAADEWVQGRWINRDGTQTYPYIGSWKQDSKGWWYGDTSGYYEKSRTVRIDNVLYTFDASGYLVQ